STSTISSGASSPLINPAGVTSARSPPSRTDRFPSCPAINPASASRRQQCAISAAICRLNTNAILAPASPKGRSFVPGGEASRPPVHGGSAHDGQLHPADQLAAHERRVAALGLEAFHLHHPVRPRVEHHDISRTPDLERAAGEP